MSEEDEVVPVSQISGWTVGPLVGHELILMQFRFLTSIEHDLEESEESCLYGITPGMAKALIIQLQDHIDSFKTSNIFLPDGPIH